MIAGSGVRPAHNTRFGSSNRADTRETACESCIQRMSSWIGRLGLGQSSMPIVSACRVRALCDDPPRRGGVLSACFGAPICGRAPDPGEASPWTAHSEGSGSEGNTWPTTRGGPARRWAGAPRPGPGAPGGATVPTGTGCSLRAGSAGCVRRGDPGPLSRPPAGFGSDGGSVGFSQRVLRSVDSRRDRCRRLRMCGSKVTRPTPVGSGTRRLPSGVGRVTGRNRPPAGNDRKRRFDIFENENGSLISAGWSPTASSI
jgi:hypothetical protein